MKRTHITLLILFLSNLVIAQNPYLPLWEHLPDGEPRVFEDPDKPGNYRAYIIGSHDTSMREYCGNDVRMWSAPVEDLSQWRDEGPIFTYYIDGQWDTMFAPDLVEVKDKKTGKKTYYLYPHSRGMNRVGMVCRSNRPDGPFEPVNLSGDGRRCTDGSLINFDPSVFIEEVKDKYDKDYDIGYRAYVFYGFKHSTAYELDQNNMYAVRPGTEIIDFFLPASSSYGEICDPEGMSYPALFQDQKPSDYNFFEASSIRQVGNKYVMVFSGYSGPDYGLGSTNSALRYAYGDTPLGPWRAGGVLVDSRGVVPNEDGTKLITTNGAHNTHGSIQQINGQWYVFYHRPPRGFGNARQSMVAPIKIEWDKKPVVQGGKVRISAYDPYSQDKEWSACASDGSHYTGAEVTSEGFQIFGLNPYNYYSAGIACYMNDNDCMQDNHDVWNNSMNLTGLKNGAIVGFKYFGFEGLKKDTKGVKAFAGTKKGDGTSINIFITPRTDEAFNMRVMIDGPYMNQIWKGKEIATIHVEGHQKDKLIKLTHRTPFVEGLKGKHAIYFVIEGPEVSNPNRRAMSDRVVSRQSGLLDLHGLGFSRTGETLEQPEVPRVDISVDGIHLNIPSTPVYSTNHNGYTECNHYQVYGKMNDKSQITVTPDTDGVKVLVGKIVDGRATVRCSYKGREKIFLIN